MFSNRIPSLDGLRAISVLAVIVGHLTLFIKPDGALAHLGFLGVKAFFIISGLLITKLMLVEQEKNGRVSLRNFYIRRALRILPLSYVFIGVVAALSLRGILKASQADLLAASTYTMSYRLNPTFVLAHLWSLSVEEQFYLVWPLGFILARGKAPAVALCAILAGPLVRTVWFLLLPSQRGLLHIAFPNVADSLAIGCFAAFHMDRLGGLARRIPTVVKLSLPLGAFAVMVSPSWIPAGLFRQAWVPLMDSVMNLILLFFILGAIYDAGRFARLLNWKPMIFVGTISYSLYIWQQLFVQQSSPDVVGILSRVTSIFCVAIAAHYLIEKPFLTLKDKVAAKAAAAAA